VVGLGEARITVVAGDAAGGDVAVDA